MWVMTEDGFYSAVQDTNNSDRVYVRARSREDIDRLRRIIGKTAGRVITDMGYDYPVRLWLTKADWANYLQNAASDITYPNFKDAVYDVNPTRAKTYGRVWGVLLDIENENEN